MAAGFYPPLLIDLSPVLWNVVRRRANLLFMNVVMKNEPSIQDVLDAVSGLSTHMDSEFANVRTELATGLHSVRSEIGEVKADLQEVGSDVSQLKTDVSELKTDVNQLKTDVRELKTDVGELKTDVSQLKTDVSELKTDVYLLKVDMSEVKEDVRNVKSDLQHVKNDVITEIDRFVVLHQSLDVELVSLRSRQNRQDHFLVKVAKKLDLEYERN
jgi:peptidoglycan hydrolase CwlO-like protein